MTSTEIIELLEDVVEALSKRNTRTSRRISALLNTVILLVDELDG